METTTIAPKNGVVIDNPKKKTYKVWSNRTESFYYQDRDPNYYRNYYHDKKEKLACPKCGRMTFNHNMRRHQLTYICERNAKTKTETNDIVKVD